MEETIVTTCQEEANIHQNLMNEAYKKWDQNTIRKYSDFLVVVLEDLSDLHYQAVITGNFNYQVENGGFSQWDFNGYSYALNDLILFFEERFPNNEIIKKVLILLYECRDIIEWVDDGLLEIEKNNSYEYKQFFQEKLGEHKGESLSKLDSIYYDLSEEFIKILEEYFKNESKKKNSTEN